MAFEAELRAYLERVAEIERVGGEPLQRRIDEDALRAYFLNRLRALEASREHRRVRELHRVWSPWLRRFARYIATLPASVAPVSDADAQVFAEHALELAMNLAWHTSVVSVEQLELERIVREFQAPWSSEIEELEEAESYAAETYLVRDEPAVGVRLTPLGTAFLRLRGKTAIRWLITSELLQNTERWDAWRTPRQLLEMALDDHGVLATDDDGDLVMPFDAGLLRRLAKLGVLRSVTKGRDAYVADDAWRDAIRAMLGTTPWHQAISAILAEDHTGIAPATRVAAEDAAEQAKMIAHEVRNALIPARIQLEALRSAVPAPQAARVEAAKRGVTRVLTFVEEMLATSELIAEQETSCEVAILVREAVRTLEGGERIHVGASTSPVRVRVPRTRLVRAISNVLRNAMQATAELQPIEISAAQLGAAVRIVVDDSGPGVPEDARERIFLDGYTTRTDGTGYGLAYVRRVVADGIRGRVWCEGSHLGGARFVIELPGIETAP